MLQQNKELKKRIAQLEKKVDTQTEIINLMQGNISKRMRRICHDSKMVHVYMDYNQASDREKQNYKWSIDSEGYALIEYKPKSIEDQIAELEKEVERLKKLIK